ncbi:MAG TPA: phosphate transport system regulatory protein PhoU [Alphaproteobacteria bacterium]|nr:phosphate transport system regulatory protein PhoU [Alphaproteobacteria bacterium]HAJ48025.1 phosphate transport system regulatory protein PhoU [Alphaproteobacteria bacterium]
MPELVPKSFSDELEGLSVLLSQMGGLVEEQLAGAIDSVVRRDLQLASNTVAVDPRVDALQHQVENRAVTLIGSKHPTPDEVREVLSAIKIAGDLERIGDLAKNVAKRAMVLGTDSPEKHLAQGLARMGSLAATQVKTVLDAYSARDTNVASTVWKRDGEIDELYNSLFRELLTYMMEDPRKISASTHLLFIAKNFERVGDHATNIAETVHYLVHGTSLGDQRPKSDITSTTNFTFNRKD